MSQYTLYIIQAWTDNGVPHWYDIMMPYVHGYKKWEQHPNLSQEDGHDTLSFDDLSVALEALDLGRMEKPRLDFGAYNFRSVPARKLRAVSRTVTTVEYEIDETTASLLFEAAKP